MPTAVILRRNRREVALLGRASYSGGAIEIATCKLDPRAASAVCPSCGQERARACGLGGARGQSVVVLERTNVASGALAPSRSPGIFSKDSALPGHPVLRARVGRHRGVPWGC